MSGTSTLGMFAKYWQPGQVKTRLASAIGADAAADLHRHFVETLLQRLSSVGDDRVLTFAPQNRAGEFFRVVQGFDWKLQPQVEGDLGARMKEFFRWSIDGGAARTVLIGSDSPNLPVEFIHQAFALLEEVPVVLGPSEDGGYYLIGVRDLVPPILQDIPWSTEGVWPRTVDRLKNGGWHFAQLPPWYDIDNVADLRRLAADLAQEQQCHPALEHLRSVIGQMLPLSD